MLRPWAAGCALDWKSEGEDEVVVLVQGQRQGQQ